MLPDIGGVELLVIAAVALIVVGPKDLPLMLRKLGQFMAKLRAMAAEFRASFDEMARQSELDELRREVEALRRGQVPGAEAEATAQTAEAEQVLRDIGDSLQGGGVQLHPPLGAPPAPTIEMSHAGAEPEPSAPAKTKPRASRAKAAAEGDAPKPRRKAPAGKPSRKREAKA